nr:hypothetical protein [Tanacetum cinerariifolium]
METPTSTILVSCDGLGGYDWSDQAKECPNYALMAFTSTKLVVLGYKSGLESIDERLKFFKSNEFDYLEDIKLLKVKIQMKDTTIIELRRKLELAQKEKDNIQHIVDKLENASKNLNKLTDCRIVDNYKKGLGDVEPKEVRKNNDALIIKEWVLDDEDEEVTQPKIEQKIVKPSISKIEFVKPKQTEKKARKTAKKVEHNRQNIHRPR